MIRTTVLFALLLISLALSAQEVIFEYYAGEVAGNIIIPYESVVFPKGGEKTTYQLYLRIKPNKGKWQDVLQNSFTIPKRAWLENNALFYKFAFTASAGSYNTELVMRDKATGVKKSFTKQFTLPQGGTEIGMTWLEAERENTSYIPSSYSSSLEKADKINLIQNYSLPLDSLRIALNEHYLAITNPTSPLHIDLKPYLEGEPISQLHLACFDDNIMYNLEPFLFTPWFSYSMRYSTEDQIDQLRYISSQNEWKVLSKLPASKHLEAIESFWRNHDPSPETLRNETREAFCTRVVTADEKYSIHKKMRGWKSDLGRIYIKYGEPDDVVSDVYPLGRYPSIVWTYYRENKRFVFADITGFGQYTLRNKEDEY